VNDQHRRAGRGQQMHTDHQRHELTRTNHG
jgi:hypothetical protein